MSQPFFNTYDPADVIFTWNGILINGFVEDTFITAERNVESYALQVGARGDSTRYRSRNKSGMFTFTVMAGSPTNDKLSAALAQDELDNSAYGTAVLRHIKGTTLVTGTNCFLQKPANAEFGTADLTREWVLLAPILDLVNGGFTVPGVA